MSVHKRSHKVEKLARIYDAEIGPIWAQRFGRMLLRDLAIPERGQVLDISCGTGTPTIEILRRMHDGSRLIAIDASSAMLDIARRKVADLGPLGKKGVFFRTESPLPKLSFANDVYDVVVCNLGLPEMPDVAAALRDFARVAKIGGEVRCTLPLAGSFQEFHDLYREVLTKHDRAEALERLDRYQASYPTSDQLAQWCEDAGLDAEIELETFAMLFRSSREFFFAPVIEYGPLADWKAVAGDGQDMQDMFWYLKETIDAYYKARAFEVTVVAACVRARKRSAAPLARAVEALRVDVPSPANPPTPPPQVADGSVKLSDVDIVEEEEITSNRESGWAARDRAHDDVALDALTAGRARPGHLDEPAATREAAAASSTEMLADDVLEEVDEDGVIDTDSAPVLDDDPAADPDPEDPANEDPDTDGKPGARRRP